MPDPLQLFARGGVAPGQRTIVDARVSALQPAPSVFTDPLFVVLDYDPDHAIQIDNWPALHGNTLPALGATVTLAYATYNGQRNWRVIDWYGIHS